jgi:hypothetical protein
MTLSGAFPTAVGSEHFALLGAARQLDQVNWC